jgi:hypothetical protein
MKRIELDINICKNCPYFAIVDEHKFCNKSVLKINTCKIPYWCELSDSEDKKIKNKFCYLCGVEILESEYICENCTDKYQT